METILLLITAVVAALALKSRADKKKADKILAETKAKDAGLELSQEEIESVLSDIDTGIEKLKTEKQAEDRLRSENMTLKERADRLRKGLK